MTPKDLESKFRWLAKWVFVDVSKNKIANDLDVALDAVDDRLDDYRSKLDNKWLPTEDEEYEMDCFFRIRSLLVKQNGSRILGTEYYRASPELSLALIAGADALSAHASRDTYENLLKKGDLHARLIELMMGRDKVAFEDLPGLIWKDENKPVSDQSIKNVVTRAKRLAKTMGMPFQLSTRDSHVIKE